MTTISLNAALGEVRTTSESSRGIHRIATLMRCPREFGYCYLMKLQLISARPAPALGTCCHVAIEAYYRGDDWMAALMGVPQRVAFKANDAIPLVQGYIKKWKKERTQDIVSLEREYPLEICGEETITRRLDRVVKRKGRVFIYDIKTAGRVKQRVAKTILDPTLFTQDMVGRWVIAPELDMRWGGVILDLIPTGHGEDYIRQPLRYSQLSLADYETSLLYWAREERSVVRAFETGGLDPWKLEQSFQCYPQGYLCDYQPLCIGGRHELSRFEVKRDDE